MTFSRNLIAALLAAALAGISTASFAQATIDHNKALAGGVTPGDAPGYPIHIYQSGHYVLKSNLVVPANTSGILVNAPNVTIDLNGFSITGDKTCTRNAVSYGVTCTGGTLTAGVVANAASAHAMVVRNGRIDGFTWGVSVVSASAIEDMTLSLNGVGVAMSDNPSSHGASRLVRSTVSMNALGARTSSAGLTITDSTFTRNDRALFNTGGADPAALSNTSIIGNRLGFESGAFGVRGIYFNDNKSIAPSATLTPF